MEDIKNNLELLTDPEEKRQFLREICKRDLFFLSEYVLRNVESETVGLDREYHGDVSDWLIKPAKRKMLLAPRGTMKSTIANRNYCIYRIINNQNITILITSATLNNAKKKLKAIKDVFEFNKSFGWLFPELIPKSYNENWTKTEILVPRTSTDPEMTIEVQGAEGELTSRHYDLIIGDDVVGKENSSTRDQINKLKNFYTQSLQLLKKPHGEYLVIGTLWNYADLYNHILENLYNEYDVFCRSIWKEDVMVKDFSSGKYIWTKTGFGKNSIVPFLADNNDLERIKKEIVADPLQGISTWMAQYELKIVDDKTAVFKRSNVKYFKIEDLKGKLLAFSLTCDPASSERREADETAFTVRAVDKENNWYIIEVFGKRGMREEEIVEKYIYFLQKYPISLCTVETIHFQRNLKYAIEKRCAELNIHLPFFALPSAFNNASKNESDLKIRGISAPYSTGKIMFLENDEETEILLDQLWRFPKSTHDDRADSAAMHIHLPIIANRVWIVDDSVIQETTPILRDRYGRPIKDKKYNNVYV